jgi:ATP synthase protein I
MISEKRNGRGRKDLYRDLEASMAGVELVVAVLVGAGLGYLADKYFGTFPYLLVIGFILGAITGFRSAFRFARKSEKRNGEKGKENEGSL